LKRQIIYPGAIPLETDLLNTNKNTMVALGKLVAATFGT
jgi:antitoxin component of RelBE/YafQ-DinJ toxin-antitoxin module